MRVGSKKLSREIVDRDYRRRCSCHLCGAGAGQPTFVRSSCSWHHIYPGMAALLGLALAVFFLRLQHAAARSEPAQAPALAPAPAQGEADDAPPSGTALPSSAYVTGGHWRATAAYRTAARPGTCLQRGGLRLVGHLATIRAAPQRTGGIVHASTATRMGAPILVEKAQVVV